MSGLKKSSAIAFLVIVVALMAVTVYAEEFLIDDFFGEFVIVADHEPIGTRVHLLRECGTWSMRTNFVFPVGTVITVRGGYNFFGEPLYAPMWLDAGYVHPIWPNPNPGAVTHFPWETDTADMRYFMFAFTPGNSPNVTANGKDASFVLDTPNSFIQINVASKDVWNFIVLPADEAVVATPAFHPVMVDGRLTPFRAFNIGGHNFFMLRDIAYVLNGTPSQFEVTWNESLNAINIITGARYTITGSEMSPPSQGGANVQAAPTTSRVYINGEITRLRAYNIDGHNFFMLRDLGNALGFGVDWEPVAQVVLVDSGANTTPPPVWTAASPNPYNRTITIDGVTYCLHRFIRAHNGGIPFYLDGKLYATEKFPSSIVAMVFFYYHEGSTFTTPGVITSNNTAGRLAYTLTLVPNQPSPPMTISPIGGFAESRGGGGINHNNPHPRQTVTLSQFTDAQFETFLESMRRQGYIWFDEPLLFNSQQLTALAELAVSVQEARNTNITLPSRRLTDHERSLWIDEFISLGGINANEFLVMRNINELRAYYGHFPQMMHPVAVMASRFYSKQKVHTELGLGHGLGPYGGGGGTFDAFAAFFGIDTTANIGGNASSGSGPDIRGWENSPGHRGALFSERHVIGVGAGWGMYIVNIQDTENDNSSLNARVEPMQNYHSTNTITSGWRNQPHSFQSRTRIEFLAMYAMVGAPRYIYFDGTIYTPAQFFDSYQGFLLYRTAPNAENSHNIFASNYILADDALGGGHIAPPPQTPSPQPPATTAVPARVVTLTSNSGVRIYDLGAGQTIFDVDGVAVTINNEYHGGFVRIGVMNFDFRLSGNARVNFTSTIGGNSINVEIVQGAQSAPPPTTTPPPTTPPPTTPSQPPPQTGGWQVVQSSIALPNRQLTTTEFQAWVDEYNSNGGATDFEIEVIRLINEIRAEHNLSQLTLQPTLMMATRFYAQTLVNLNGSRLSHTFGPYGGSGGTARAFGSGWNTANATTASSSPQATVTSWMNSPGHRANILNSSARVIGIGRYGNVVYMLTHSTAP